MMQAEQFEALIAGLEGQGISRTEIAQATGLSRDTIWRLASGISRQPSHETVERLHRFAEKNYPAVRHLGQKYR
jgi:transcriptional regulator with XRE-family HTH domain